MIRTLLATTILFLSSLSGLQAALELPNFFSDHMVLQQGDTAAIWGKAKPKEKVTVRFKGNTSTTRADAQGNWRTDIKTGAADSNGSLLVVLTESSGEKSIQDVVVGEVWLASGQSNMAMVVRSSPEYKELAAGTNMPRLRMFNASPVTAVDPKSDIPGTWSQADPTTVPGYSGAAFFFARMLVNELDVPVGVIKTAWGGKPVETFTSREALNTHPGTKALVDQLMAQDAAYDPVQAAERFKVQEAAWKKKMEEWKAAPAAERKGAPRKPRAPKRPLDSEGKPGVLFNSMIHPFVGYTMRGAIWYQGEANARFNAVPYDETLPLMINDWRTRWDDDFSFYFVQLANFRKASTEPGTPDAWALLQDRMRLVLKTTPKTGMAVINDVGHPTDIHPKNKRAVGERLARWALAKDYGKDVVASGPLLATSIAMRGSIIVGFDHVGDGLRSRDGKPLKRFEIAGADQKWHWADAKLVAGDQVMVSSPAVPEPKAVRYAWASNPEGANLVNSEGLPASVFRTDDWDDAENEPKAK